MKVRLIKKQTLEDFSCDYPDAWSSLEDWVQKIRYAQWETPADIRRTFNTADLLGNGSQRVVFNVGGNKYRIIAKYWFGPVSVHLYIKWVGIHAEYTWLCSQGRQYTVDQY